MNSHIVECNIVFYDGILICQNACRHRHVENEVQTNILCYVKKKIWLF